MEELKSKLSPRQARKFARLRRFGAELKQNGNGWVKPYVIVLPPEVKIAGHEKSMRSWCLS